MKNLKHFTFLFTVCAALLAGTSVASAWGQKGHDVTCEIAKRHLTAKAQKKISDILDGKSIVYWANWLDNASHTPEYAYTKTWHYKNIDAGETYDNAPLCQTGDVVTAIDAQVKALKSGELNKDAAALALKMLVHLVGDLHNPMHIGHRSDRGGNRLQVQFFHSGKNLHGIWDTDMVERAHRWTYSEWADEIDTVGKSQIKEMVKGTPSDWGRETYEITTRIYDGTPVGSKLSYDYVSVWTPVIEDQMEKGGLRLANLLNEIFR